jgi:Ca2+-binding EF-hand superfamily protein
MQKSLVVLAAFIMSPAVMAQDAPQPSPGAGMPQPEQIFAFLDANKDGFIAKDEAQGPLVQYFGNIDTDKDDKISMVELKTAMDAMRPPEPAQGASE